MPKHTLHSRFLQQHQGPGIPFWADRPGAQQHARGGSSSRRARWARTPLLQRQQLLLVAGWLLAVVCLVGWRLSARSSARQPSYMLDPVLVSYAYFEKDATQMANFEFFLAVGSHYPALHTNMHWVFVVSGDKCTPCKGLYSVLPGRAADASLAAAGIKEARFSEKFSLLARSENIGMDLGAHNATLEWLSYRGTLTRYKYFIFLNSSVKGPFVPSWTPPEWHWAYAYLAAFSPTAAVVGGGDGVAAAAVGAAFPGYAQAAQGRRGSSGSAAAAAAPTRPIHAVGSSLVCLPPDDAGGPGARLESWAFALDTPGLAAAVEAGVFLLRGCKKCVEPADSIVVGGEYGLTLAQFAAGFNVATLLSRYARGTDWSDPAHWACNDNVHPSRAGLYGGVSVHPYETVFVKSSWHVAEPYTKRYSQWALQHLLGRHGTEGSYNRALYLYGVSARAEQPRDLEAAYRALSQLPQPRRAQQQQQPQQQQQQQQQPAH